MPHNAVRLAFMDLKTPRTSFCQKVRTGLRAHGCHICLRREDFFIKHRWGQQGWLVTRRHDTWCNLAKLRWQAQQPCAPREHQFSLSVISNAVPLLLKSYAHLVHITCF
jgi:hypothetical protein